MPALEKKIDILIVGGGSAALAAAAGAAKQNKSVAIVEKLGFLGGMATAAEVGTVCGLFYCDPLEARFANKTFPERFSKRLQEKCKTNITKAEEGLWFLPYKVHEFKLLCDDLCKESGAEVFLHTNFCRADLLHGKISSIQVICLNEVVNFHPKAVIDCSGESLVSRMLNLPMILSEENQAGAFVFTLHCVKERDHSILSKEIIMQLLKGTKESRLPQGCEKLSIIPGSLIDGRLSLKLSLPALMHRSPNFMSEIEMDARIKASAVHQFLKSNSELFRESEIASSAAQVGIRTGPRGIGKYVLSKDDVLSCAKFTSAIAKGVWPIEKWGDHRSVQMTYFNTHGHYDIPLGCLMSANVENLFFAGRSISADEDAIASARVIGTCLATGYAAGIASALYSEKMKIEDVNGTMELLNNEVHESN